MDSAPLTIAMVGGIPPVMGGGGLEVQIDRTQKALRAAGHRVVGLESLERDEPFDVLHGFHAEPLLWHMLPHWTRNTAPLVVSPVLPVAPGAEARNLALMARLPTPVTTARMRRAVFRAADAVIALTEFERSLIVRTFGGPAQRTWIIGNGVDTATPEPTDVSLPTLSARPVAVMVGNISRRKRQQEVLDAGVGRHSLVLAGEFLGNAEERATFETAVARNGAHWLGQVPPGAIPRLLRASSALVLLSRAEGLSLAVLEALATGTPVIASDLPAHRELARRYPGWVRVVRDASEVAAALDGITAQPPSGPPPTVPSWDEVGQRLLHLYREILRHPRRDAGPP
jgi:glycosyltransferase involved in cell wall biosynthesis